MSHVDKQRVETPPGHEVSDRYDTFQTGDMTVIYDKESNGNAWIAAENPIEIHGD